ncbi:Uncharacterised protein [uncultured archaeon]|nr:Uncharacterised protein [uncultured archaeon]
MAKKKAKGKPARAARKAPSASARKQAARRRLPKQKILHETFSLPAQESHEFKAARIAPPEEPLAIAQPSEHSRARKSAIPNSITAAVGSLVATSLVAAFLTMALGISPVYTIGISAAVFVGFSIVFYTILATQQ